MVGRVDWNTIKIGDLIKYKKGTGINYITNTLKVVNVIMNSSVHVISVDEPDGGWGNGHTYSYNATQFNDQKRHMEFISMVPRNNFLRPLGLRYGKTISR